MPQYRGEEVGQDFLDMITRVYKEQYEAAHGEPMEDDDATIVAALEAANVTGGPEASALAREPIVEEPPVEGEGGILARRRRRHQTKEK